MRKKEFKMLVETNPALYQWLKENKLWLKSKPEVMVYLTQHPDAIKQFRTGQAIENEKIYRNSQLFINEIMQERKERKNKRRPEGKEKAPKEKDKKGGLLNNLKSMFSKTPAVVPASSQLPVLHPPGVRTMGRSPVTVTRPAHKPTTTPTFNIPKLKLNRKKLMSTLNQTTEMLDVVGALLGKVSNIK